MDHILAWKRVEQIALSATKYPHSPCKFTRKIFHLTKHDFPTPPDPKTHNLYSESGISLLPSKFRNNYFLSFVNYAPSTGCKSTLLKYWLSFSMQLDICKILFVLLATFSTDVNKRSFGMFFSQSVWFTVVDKMRDYFFFRIDCPLFDFVVVFSKAFN